MRKSESNIRQSINLCSTLIGLIVWTALLLVLTAWTAAAAPGDLDLTFSGDGKMTDLFPGVGSVHFRATAVQSDGKIVAVGNDSFPRQYFYVARYNADGSPDTTFGGTGKVRTQFGPFNTNYISDVAIQPDGKIVAAGCYCQEDFGPPVVAFARYNSDGSLDTSFGGDGIVLMTKLLSNTAAYSVALQADGKIVAGAFYNGNWLVTRFNNDGSPDTTFNGTGYVVTAGLGVPYSVAIQADGKIVAAGSSVYTGSPGDFAIARYNANGSLDTTFDGDGIVITPVDPGRDEIRSIAIQADGKIVAAGPTNWIGPNNDFAVVRYNANGSLDMTFDNDGIVTTPIGTGMDGASAVAIQSDGKIVASGYSYNGANNDFALARYNPNGSLDTTFGGGDGKTTVDFDISNDSANGMALDNAGRAVVVGESKNLFAIARFLLGPSGTPFDYDGDGRADISVFRLSDGTWYLNRSTAGFTATQFGLSTDKLTPADFDGDGRTDISVFRDGVWYWLNSLNGNFNAVQFGMSGDIPVPADYTGDGRAELAVYRGGVWYTHNLANNQTNAVQFGLATDKPVVGDYDGDGRADHAVYREGTWYLLRSTQGFAAIQFGLSTDKLVPADYDGDGKTDQAVYRDGAWYVFGSQTGFTPFQFGLASDIPAPADYDGDGRTDAAVYRDGVWYLLQSTAGASTVQFGLANDRPIPSAYMP